MITIFCFILTALCLVASYNPTLVFTLVGSWRARHRPSHLWTVGEAKAFALNWGYYDADPSVSLPVIEWTDDEIRALVDGGEMLCHLPYLTPAQWAMRR